MGNPDTDDLGERLIQAVHAASGEHPGHRTLHAKGAPAVGTFTATGDAARLTSAGHLQPGVVTPVDVRFSNGSADPDQADGARDGRGFAVKFRLADGTSTDIVALTLPVFFVRTVPDFLALMAARVPDPATGEMDLDKVFAFLGEHPEAGRAVELSLAAPAPVSYTTVPYHGVHAFWAVAADGTRSKVRYRWEPDAEVAVLSDDEAAARDPGYLASELAERLAGPGAAFTLHLTIGTDEDDENDPTIEWPADREDVVAGTLTLTGPPADPQAIDALIFDPVRVTPGIETSDDEILHARSAAYGVSYASRTGELTDVKNAAKAGNEVLRFLLELCALAAFGWWALQAIDGPLRFVAATTVIVAAGALWGVLVAPTSARRLPDPARLLVESTFFLLAGLALVASSRLLLGILLGVLGIANATTLRLHEPVLGAIGPDGTRRPAA